MPAWTGINVIMGGVIGTFASIERKKKFFEFMFGTICEKVNVLLIQTIQENILRETRYQTRKSYGQWISLMRNWQPCTPTGRPMPGKVPEI